MSGRSNSVLLLDLLPDSPTGQTPIGKNLIASMISMGATPNSKTLELCLDGTSGRKIYEIPEIFNMLIQFPIEITEEHIWYSIIDEKPEFTKKLIEKGGKLTQKCLGEAFIKNRELAEWLVETTGLQPDAAALQWMAYRAEQFIAIGMFSTDEFADNLIAIDEQYHFEGNLPGSIIEENKNSTPQGYYRNFKIIKSLTEKGKYLDTDSLAKLINSHWLWGAMQEVWVSDIEKTNWLKQQIINIKDSPDFQNKKYEFISKIYNSDSSFIRDIINIANISFDINLLKAAINNQNYNLVEAIFRKNTTMNVDALIPDLIKMNNIKHDSEMKGINDLMLNHMSHIPLSLFKAICESQNLPHESLPKLYEYWASLMNDQDLITAYATIITLVQEYGPKTRMSGALMKEMTQRGIDQKLPDEILNRPLVRSIRCNL